MTRVSQTWLVGYLLALLLTVAIGGYALAQTLQKPASPRPKFETGSAQ